jgi:hypothetical protein
VSCSRKKWSDAHPGYQKQYWQTECADGSWSSYAS